MKRLLIITIASLPAIAIAEPHHVLVLRSEGGGDAALHAKVDAAVLKLAKNVEGNVEMGEITLTDAVAATGCSLSDASCKDEVLGTLGVDELVATTITPGPVETKVTVRRLAKGSAAQNGASTIPSNQPLDAKLAADVGPLFGVKATPLPVEPTITPPPPTNPPPVTPPPPTTGTTFGSTTDQAQPQPLPPAPPAEHDNRKLELAGIVGGGVLVIAGIVLWGEAASTQNDITNAPVKTVGDFHNLQNLESQGDAFALGGNIVFFGGVALAAVSGYFYWRDHRRAERRTARVAPVVFPHGAGVTLTFGGRP